MADKVWRDVPWASKTKDSHDHLLDIMLRIPTILADFFNEDKRPTVQEILDAAIQRVRVCWRLDSQLNDWLEGQTVEHSGPLFWPETSEEFVSSRSTGSDTDDLFTTAYDFPSFLLAQSLLLYWLSRMMVSYQLGRVYQKLQDLAATLESSITSDAKCTCHEKRRASLTSCLLHFNFTQLPPLGYRSDWSQTAARNIGQSVAYFLQEKMRCTGPACLFAPLRILWWHWGHDYSGQDRRRELRWVGSMLGKVQARGNKIVEVV